MHVKQDFVSNADLTSKQFNSLLRLAAELKQDMQINGSNEILRGKTLGMLFTKPSLRTRVSFEMGMRQLGGHALYVGPEEVQLGKRESVPDVARVFSRYVDCIMARVFSHDDVLQLAQYSRVPIINGLSDASHPCQALSDIFTLVERFGSVKGMQVSFIGDANNVCAELAYACAHAGCHLTIGAPEGYQLAPDIARRASAIAINNGGSLTQVADPQSAAEDAQVIYTDVWISMGQESEAAIRNSVFPPYQVNQKLMNLARKDAVVMHCLPAHRGHEITGEVADGDQSALWDQAENRMHGQKAILVKLMRDGTFD